MLSGRAFGVAIPAELLQRIVKRRRASNAVPDLITNTSERGGISQFDYPQLFTLAGAIDRGAHA